MLDWYFCYVSWANIHLNLQTYFWLIFFSLYMNDYMMKRNQKKMNPLRCLKLILAPTSLKYIHCWNCCPLWGWKILCNQGNWGSTLPLCWKLVHFSRGIHDYNKVMSGHFCFILAYFEKALLIYLTFYCWNRTSYWIDHKNIYHRIWIVKIWIGIFVLPTLNPCERLQESIVVVRHWNWFTWDYCLSVFKLMGPEAFA